MPKVTLITTVFNRPRLADAAIMSVRNQDFTDFEYLIHDDGSDDETKKVLQRHALQDKRIKLTLADHVGALRALDAAHERAEGEYVGWIDSDDLLHPSCVRETVEHLDQNPAAGMIYTDQVIINDQNKPLGIGNRAKIPYSPERLLIDFMTFHFRLFRRPLFEQVGGLDHDLPCAHDYDFCLKLSEVTQIAYLPRPLYLYRMHRDSITGSKRLRQIEGSAMAVRKALSRRGLDKTHDLDLDLTARFRIKRRTDAPAADQAKTTSLPTNPGEGKPNLGS